jgi:putative tryptophan/tyrosine transport system substrate-binding protein
MKGAKPEDLPVDRPTTFDFVNFKTPQAPGATTPRAVLQQAAEVIQ